MGAKSEENSVAAIAQWFRLWTRVRIPSTPSKRFSIDIVEIETVIFVVAQ